MNRSGAPANCWLLCLIYVCYLLNHIACSALDGKIPLLCPHEMPSSKIVELILSLRVVVVAINFSRTGATSIALSKSIPDANNDDDEDDDEDAADDNDKDCNIISSG